MQTNFNHETKIWEGASYKSVFNPKAGVGDILLYCLKRNLDAVAQINDDDGTTLTFGQVLAKTIRLAENLKKHGFKEGDVISLVSSNNSEACSILFGCFMAGLPINPLNPSAGTEDYQHMFEITKPKLVFCEKNNMDKVKQALDSVGIESKILVIDDDGKNCKNLTMSMLLEPVVNEFFYSPTLISSPESTISLIMCSSGTTGLPKAVCLSHSQIIANTLRTGNISPNDVYFTFSTLYWITGMSALLTATVHGSKRIITSKPFSPAMTLSIIQKYKVTVMFSPPSNIAKLLENPKIKNADLSSVRIYFTGGSRVFESLEVNLKKHLPNGVLMNVFGITELASAVSVNFFLKPGSVGKPTSGVKIKIVDENRKPLGPNEIGEIAFRTEYTFLGYLGNPEATNASLDSDGWFYTGDMGYFDDTHHLFIVGRSKEIIKFENYQISPIEIEEFLQKELGLMETCVIGIDDLEHGNELPAVAVVKEPKDHNITEQDIIQSVEKDLSDFKRLRGGVYFLDKFPLTATGKIKRKEVKQIVSELYNQKDNN